MSLFTPCYTHIPLHCTSPNFQASIAPPCPYSVLLHYMKIVDVVWFVCVCLGFFSYAEKFSVVTIIYIKIKKSLSRSIQVQTKPKENQSRGFVLVSAMVGNRAVPSMSHFSFWDMDAENFRELYE